jgi:regulator of sigma E protease
MMTIVQLFLVLALMVFIHELGHFAMAKWCRVRVESFALGFGKRIAGFTRGGTEYRINLLPLGGYVRMTGEVPGEDTTDDPGNLNNHPRWQRMLIALAGPIANFVLAFSLMTCAFMLHNQVNQYSVGPATTDYISPSTAVTSTGIRSGDTIVHFDTVENPTWEDVLSHASLNPNRTIPFSYVHDGQRTDTTFLVAASHSEKFTIESVLALGLVPRMQNVPLRIESLAADGPADRAGLKPNDQVLSVDGTVIRSMTTLSWYLKDQQGKPVVLNLLRDGRSLNLTVTPQKADPANTSSAYQIGFAPAAAPAVVQQMSLASALGASWSFNRRSSLLVADVFKSMFERHISVKNLSGPIGIGQVVHHAASAPGWLPLIAAVAMISINLGIFNLLPFPILDGGMIFLLIVESTFRRNVPIQVKKHIYQAAFVCILLFAVMVIFNDITKLPFFLHVKS